MKCTTCGAELRPTRTDLPFKASDSAIVIAAASDRLRSETSNGWSSSIGTSS
jgi:hypothetical protein